MIKLSKHKSHGFMGRTHFLISMTILLLCAFIPIDFVQDFMTEYKSSILLFLVGIVIYSGGALFVDLDDVHNSAYMLGALSSIFTLFMQTTSAIVWNLYHGKRDQTPRNREGKPTQHRYLWHTPFIAICMFLLFYYGLPNGDYTIFVNISNSISTGQLDKFIMNNSILTLFIVLSFMSTFIGSAMIIKMVNKVFKLPKYLSYILPVLVLIYIFTTTYDNIRILGLLFVFGYMTHEFADAFSDSGICMFFPIPFFWEGKVWKKIRLLPVTVTTGGIVNNIIDFIFGVVVLILLVLTVANW